jgi:hypothetical protein
MGANATTFVPAYVASEVLTAANLNVTNSGIPVFATTVTRDAAFGGTGEKTLAEGQFAYIEATNTTQYYDGAAWQSVGTTPGLVYLTGASFTTATSVSLPNSTFTSTYRNYRILFTLSALTADADITVRMRASGTDDSGANYFTMFSGVRNDAVAVSLVNTLGTSWNFAESDSPFASAYSFCMDVLQPQIATTTELQGTLSWYAKATAVVAGASGSAWQNTSTAYDSLSVISSVASSMTGVYRVYGYSES